MADEGSAAQYVVYTFYKVDAAWRRLPIEEREAGKEAFADVIDAWQERMQILTYGLAGTRPDTDFFLWKLTERFDDFADLATDLNATPLAGWLTTPHSYLAATLSSKYFDRDPKRARPSHRASAGSLSRRLSVRQAQALVLAPAGGAPQGDEGARRHRQ